MKPSVPGAVRILFTLCIFTLFACQQKKTLFTLVDPGDSGVSFANKLQERKLFGILYFLYYYNGGGVATGDINNDGLTDIYFTANSRGNNKLYLNKGNFQFEDITAKAGVAGGSDWCSGVTMADVNGDGLLDIYVSSVSGMRDLKGRNELFINNGKGSFTERAKEYGLDFSGFSSQAAFFDYDHDGDLDCYLVNQSHHPHANIVDTSFRKGYDSLSGDRLYRNDGPLGKITPGDVHANRKVGAANSPSTGGNRRLGAKLGGEAVFVDVSKQAGIFQSSLGYGLGLAIADLNNDGWEDIYVGNDFHENDYYYVNNGDGTFRESGAQHFKHYSRFSMGNDAADYNNDGQLDLITVDMLPPDEKTLKTYGSDENPDIYNVKLLMNGYQHQYSRNVLQRNNGNGSSFSDVALQSGVAATDWSWAPLFADFDNDGNKDLFISSGIVKRPVDLDYVRFVSDLQVRKGMNQTDKYDQAAIEKMPGGDTHPFLFKGDGSGGFAEMDTAWGTAGMKGCYNGAAYADLDNDGDLDMVVNAIDAPAVLMRNDAPATNHLAIQFKGDGGNTMGLGARAYVFAGGSMQYQQLVLTRGFQSSVAPVLHFGLGAHTKADSVVVVWPGQRYQVLRDVAANKTLTAVQANAAGVFEINRFVPSPASFLTPVTDSLVRWKHAENPFVDVNVQYLVPHALSSRGPKLAVADVNGDGLDDFYAGGAKDQAGVLMLGRIGGDFVAVKIPVFEADRYSEDVAALFTDVNGDNFPDLVVASGGNELLAADPRLWDRLYLNDGKGGFAKSKGLPFISSNKSCVAAADVDGDGDRDLFLGVLANSVAYGVPQTSVLLLNDGKGNFTKAEGRMPLQNIGMVTAARFADVDGNKLPDLVLAGEWMPLTIMLNKGGRFERSTIPASSGWWQSLYVGDVNGDGFLDILAGNWGLNNKFQSRKDGKLSLYVSDFDRNGSTDQLLAYSIKGKEYPFLAKDETERALPVLKKHYLLYAEYAGEEMKDVFYGFVDQVEPLRVEQLASVVCLGNGKGGFSMQALPAELQLAPIFSFAPLGGNRYVAGGNFYDVIPYEGRYDGQPLALFQFAGNKVLYLHQPDLFHLSGQVRDLQWVNRKGDSVLAIARNNQPLVFYRGN
ncbi:Repeat domain-containing protein [Cnuella takakiae]|uniref:Repeat domain-containing protein n=1 Tax=Cnuella takakiae TaxID=1302690 RepID=A0A1M4ZHV3_9BACT|nr:VCBS repeat-containing protein [Cnuella takakiae]OLY94206.1 hypothetical protein BUE76_21695 [Cnuella takakiae]SHF17613.1 Repeat domain-containing protein [Cnuella takakiae]